MSAGHKYMKNRYENMKIGMILLAAGCSRRFGSNKLLYEIEGKPMYLRALERLLEVQRIHFSPAEKAADTQGRKSQRGKSAQPEGNRRTGEKITISIAVVTQYEEIRRTAAKMEIPVILNPHPEEGIASSMKLGLAGFSDTDACLFSVADQPWLKAETVMKLVKLFLDSGKGIACLSENGVPGNPCIFSRKYYPELMELTGDRGGKRVLNKHPEDTVFLEAEDGRELKDVDCPESGIREHSHKNTQEYR